MRVYVDVPKEAALSRAMHRVARALRETAPTAVRIVDSPSEADVQVLHVIGPHQEHRIVAKEYVPIQYCWKTAGGNSWDAFWRGSRFVWSYYDLPAPRLLYAPMGVDTRVFYPRDVMRTYGVMTSGYVHGSAAEAIEEPADAAWRTGRKVLHLGPSNVVGMKARRERTWTSMNGVKDETLAELYSAARFVSGLRHVEGFELGVLEGMLCGAWGLVFDRPEMRHWYGTTGGVVFLRESEGAELIEQLVPILRSADQQCSVSPHSRARVAEKFSWVNIGGAFWKEMAA